MTKTPRARSPRADAMTPDQDREASTIMFAMILAATMRDPLESGRIIARALVKLRTKVRKHVKRTPKDLDGMLDVERRALDAARSHVDGLLATIAGEVAQNAITARYQVDGSLCVTAYNQEDRTQTQLYFT